MESVSASRPQRLLVYGDQTDRTDLAIKHLFEQAKSSVLLSSFLSRCADSLQTAIAALDWLPRRFFPSFRSILDLSLKFESSDGSSGPVSLVLSYVTRIGELLIYAEKDPVLLTSPMTVLGLCVGLLPAVVAAAAKDARELADLGLTFIPFCVRLAVSAEQRTRRLEVSTGAWSYVLKDIHSTSLQSVIDEFHAVSNLTQAEPFKAIPRHRGVYISVLGPNWTTVSGPPSTLRRFLSWSPRVTGLPQIRIPIAVLAHAPHLPLMDYEWIMGNSPALEKPLPERISIISTSTCMPYTGRTLGAVLLEVLKDALDRPLRLVDCICATISRMYGGGDIDIIRVGPMAQTKFLEKVLQQMGMGYTLTMSPQLNADGAHGIRGGSDKIAIVGMAGRFPQSNSVDELWRVILEGVETHTEIPPDRFDVEQWYDSAGNKPNSTAVRHGCFINNPGEFDARLFNASPREAFQMDPLHRLLLMTAHEALENSGYSPSSSLSTDRKRVAVYAGQCVEPWRDVLSSAQGTDVYTAPGLLRAFAPGRLNYHFGFEGPSYSVDAACSSSSTAIALACSALIARECDMALAGGAQLANTPLEYSSLDKAGMLSTTGGCKTFRADADGYCRGEGVGMVVLKRLEDALAENDNIVSVISGWGRNHSANAISITHPHSETQQQLYRQVLQQAGIEPTDVGYVEMHGTATQAGDVVEMDSVLSVFARDRSPNNPLHLGAVKANIGHGEAVAGVSAVVKASMMLQEGLIPPQAGMPRPLNPNFPDLNALNVRIPSHPIPLSNTNDKSRQNRILVNNFDAAGGNTCLLLENSPCKEAGKNADPREWHVVALSGRTARSLRGNQRRLLSYLEAHKATRLADLAYSTTARRMHETLRVAYTGSSVDDIISQLEANLHKSPDTERPSLKTKSTVIFTFTGQGSQYAGMGCQIFHQSRRFRGEAIELQKIATHLGFPYFLDIIRDADVTMAEKSTTQVQLAILTLEIALAHLWMSWGLKPLAVMGHSLGEYAALCVAGVLSASDAVFLVGTRATLVESRCTVAEYGMLSTTAPAETIQQVLQSSGLDISCQISCLNAPASTVVSGKKREIEQLAGILEQNAVHTRSVRVPYGFHSAQLDPILDDFEAAASSVNFGAPAIPVMSTLNGKLVGDSGVFTASYLPGRCASHFWLELGPTPFCTGFVKSTLKVPPERTLASLKAGEPDFKTLSSSLGQLYQNGVHIQWAEFHKEYLDSVSLVDMPTYAFDTKNFWETYKTTNSWGTISATDGASQPGKLLTSALQKITSETVSGQEIRVVFESKAAQEDLFAAINGHIISGVALCPSSVFADMALGAAKYVRSLAHPRDPIPSASLCDLDIFNALVLSPSDETQTLRVTASAAAEDMWKVHLSFSSSSKRGGKDFVAAADATSISATIESLKSRDSEEHVSRLKRPYIYKLFNSVVRYDEAYQGLHEIYMDEDKQDAVAVVKLRPRVGRGTWTANPYWTDSMVHLAGFILNGSSKTPEDVAYISGGLDRMTLVEELAEGTTYHSYVHMRSAGKKGASIGDVYMLDGARVIGCCEGVKFQQMKKSVLNTLLGVSEPDITSVRRTSTTQQQSPVTTTLHRELPSGKPVLDPVNQKPTPPRAVSGTRAAKVDDGEIAEIFLEMVIAETGFDASEVHDDTEFADMGVDSLMSMVVVDAIKRRTGVVLPLSLFLETATVGALRTRFGSKRSSGGESPKTATNAPTSNSENSASERSDNDLDPVWSTTPPTDVDEPAFLSDARPTTYSSTAVLIQGGEADATEPPLFLICDGIGSAVAFADLPPLPSSTALYALESPFLEDPAALTCSVEALAPLYERAIKAVQRAGPYRLGGLSAGAAFAYEVARQMLARGEQVLGLLLIDMKVPRGVPHDPQVGMPTREAIGMFARLRGGGGGGGAHSRDLGPLGEKTLEHVLATSLSVTRYDPLPMRRGQQPAKGTLVVWARRGLCETADAQGRDAAELQNLVDPAGKNIMYDHDVDFRAWFCSRRHDFGANGWDRLVGAVETLVVDGDHFSLVQKPYVDGLGRAIEQALAKFSVR
ncbi:polyketide product template domain-containing protein isoform 2 [Cladophialophora immunda]|nr:polyketide product template domain-containing protein isoform 2 [Cladophialophora immunda]